MAGGHTARVWVIDVREGPVMYYEAPPDVAEQLLEGAPLSMTRGDRVSSACAAASRVEEIPEEELQNLIDRIGSYSPWSIAFELVVIGLVVWAVVRFFQGTRAAGALKGLLLILVVGTLIVRVIGAGGSVFSSRKAHVRARAD